MTNKEAPIPDNTDQIAELQKENKKLKEINEGLVKTQIKVLQNALHADQETTTANELTIQNGKKWRN